jgi:hypothetical protein
LFIQVAGQQYTNHSASASTFNLSLDGLLMRSAFALLVQTLLGFVAVLTPFTIAHEQYLEDDIVVVSLWRSRGRSTHSLGCITWCWLRGIALRLDNSKLLGLAFNKSRERMNLRAASEDCAGLTKILLSIDELI